MQLIAPAQLNPMPVTGASKFGMQLLRSQIAMASTQTAMKDAPGAIASTQALLGQAMMMEPFVPLPARPDMRGGIAELQDAISLLNQATSVLPDLSGVFYFSAQARLSGASDRFARVEPMLPA